MKPFTCRATIIVSLITFLAIAATSAAGGIKPFTTDGCSSFPDGTPKQKDLWLSCCTQHDRAYWIGGTYGERLKADQELEACVEKVGEPAIAKLMLAGVRVGGTPYLPTKFRWGYGWPWPRGYKKITEEDRKMIQQMQGDK